MHSGLISFLPLRVRLSLAIAACTLPFGLLFVFANVLVYQPLQRELQAIAFTTEHRFESISRLQLALARSAMPVNDYLIHGREEERGEFMRLTAHVETSFDALHSELLFAAPIDRILLESLRDRWHLAKQRGERILQFDARSRRAERADAMEEFDADIDHLVGATERLVERIRNNLSESRAEVEARHAQLNLLAGVAAAVAALITLLVGIYISQSLLAPLVEQVEEEQLAEEDRATFLLAAAHGHARKELLRAADMHPPNADGGRH